eukprot:gene9492-1698_t
MSQGTEEPKKKHTRRDTLQKIEQKVQKRWLAEKPYDRDAPEDLSKPKYLITFPYPYMNGRLHLGHAFSLTKTEFAARFHTLLGENVLFPFAFHCTGMPIVAAADKLKREIQTYGNPPTFPVEEVVEKKQEVKVEKEVDPTKFSGAKGKLAGKTDKKAVYQWNILKGMGISEEEIPKFADPVYWTSFFPPLGKQDLYSFGCAIDFRRSFITTDVNPFYDSFIRWQFNRLKELGYLTFLNRYSIYSTIDGQPCADHDRATGEGVKPQEYTLIKMKVQTPFPKALASLEGKDVFFVCATLRPETMYGQTNCWIKSDGKYGAFALKNGEVVVCTERAARNLAYQEYCEFGKVNCLVSDITGSDLIGTALSAPNSLVYKTVYCLPMINVSTKKGTGIVTSVPSDSPDDYMALLDLKTKEKFRELYNVKEEWVKDFEVVPIIDIPELGDKAAVTVCEKMKIKSQKDQVELGKAKKEVYKHGFYSGILTVGPHKGSKVLEAKEKITQQLLDEGVAIKYAEPESEVLSRSGDNCVVAMTDQWFLKYGEENWRKTVEEYTMNEVETYSDSTKNSLIGTINWLKEWACSREYGLGTKLPFDERYVVESLSDSTIYNAFYTFAHILQGGVLDGSVISDVKPEHLTKGVWDYILVGGEYPTDSQISKDALKKMKTEFDYWYGVDLRSSGKDLIQNHLTMYLYNHAAIFPDKKHWPKSIFANGHVLVDDEKMSKSKGNFILLDKGIEDYTADGIRIGLADAGDGLEDGNFKRQTADDSILRLTTYLKYVESFLEKPKTEKLPSDFVKEKEKPVRIGSEELFADKVFYHRLIHNIKKAKESYSMMRFREALHLCFYELHKIKDDYIVQVDGVVKQDLMMKFIEYEAIIMSPIRPHFSEHIWELIGKKTRIENELWPEVPDSDLRVIRSYFYFQNSIYQFRSKLNKEKDTAKKSKKEWSQPKGAYIYVMDHYATWQLETLKVLREIIKPTDTQFPVDLSKMLKGKVDGKNMKNIMMFVGYLRLEFEKYGMEALNDELPFDEYGIFEENASFVKSSLGFDSLTIFKESDKNVVDPKNRMKLVSTGNPQIHFVHE